MYHKKNKKEIEIVCSGNNERSYLGEVLGQQKVEDMGADEIYAVLSSGSAAKKLRSGNAPLKFKLSTIESGLKSGLYSNTKLVEPLIGCTEEKYNSEPDTKAAINTLYETARIHFAAEGREHVNQALKKMGLEKKIYEGWNQTTAADNVEAIFPMAESNIVQVKDIYANSQYELPSIVDSPKAYVTGNSKDQIPNAFGGSKKVFEDMIEEVSHYVPKAVEKVLNTKG